MASVWPCGSRDCQATAEAAQAGPEWLERAVLRLVTSYTEPGHRVLLIAPPPPRTRRPPRWTTSDRRDRPDPYLDVLDTNWAISRLGRSAQTTLAAHPTGPHGSPGDPRVGQRPRDVQPHRGRPPDPALSLTHDDQAVTGSFDLIVTVANPHDHAWLAARDWSALLRGSGILAIITHSDIDRGELRDPSAHIVLTIRNRGLVWVDHIVLLDRDPDRGIPPRPPDVEWRATRHIRSHHDLLIFERRP
ncbi:hypothetical protein GCM10025762_41730 [Haloechinothrix salitolerans]